MRKQMCQRHQFQLKIQQISLTSISTWNKPKLVYESEFTFVKGKGYSADSAWGACLRALMRVVHIAQPQGHSQG